MVYSYLFNNIFSVYIKREWKKGSTAKYVCRGYLLQMLNLSIKRFMRKFYSRMMHHCSFIVTADQRE